MELEIRPKQADQARRFEASGSRRQSLRQVRRAGPVQGLRRRRHQRHCDTRLSFTNGVVLTAGEAIGDVNESRLRRIQIREAIKAHFEKEQQLFAQGIKVLSLFFIDEVAKYRRLQPGRREGRVRPDLRGGIRDAQGRVLCDWRWTTRRTKLPRTASRPPRRMTDTSPSTRREAAGRSGVKARGEVRGLVGRRGRLRPDPEEQGATAIVRRAGAVHLLALGIARGLGQSECLRHRHAEAQRQHDLAPAGGRTRPALVGQSERRSHGRSGDGASRSTC